MSEEITVKTGTKVDAAEQKNIDPATVGLMIAGPPPNVDVEGQAYWGYTRCPYCGHVGRSLISSRRYIYYNCGYCGGLFRA